MPWIKRRALLPLACFVNWIFTGLYLSDAHNGYRALTRQAARKCEIRQDRMAHATEVLGLIRKHRLRFLEVPVVVEYNEFGQGLAGGLRVVRELLQGRIFR